MRYCAGTCPCTWVTAIALPNIVYFRKLRRNQGAMSESFASRNLIVYAVYDCTNSFKGFRADKTGEEARGSSILTGISRQQVQITIKFWLDTNSFFCAYISYQSRIGRRISRIPHTGTNLDGTLIILRLVLRLWFLRTCQIPVAALRPNAGESFGFSWRRHSEGSKHDPRPKSRFRV